MAEQSIPSNGNTNKNIEKDDDKVIQEQKKIKLEQTRPKVVEKKTGREQMHTTSGDAGGALPGPSSSSTSMLHHRDKQDVSTSVPMSVKDLIDAGRIESARVSGNMQQPREGNVLVKILQKSNFETTLTLLGLAGRPLTVKYWKAVIGQTSATAPLPSKCMTFTTPRIPAWFWSSLTENDIYGDKKFSRFPAEQADMPKQDYNTHAHQQTKNLEGFYYKDQIPPALQSSGDLMEILGGPFEVDTVVIVNFFSLSAAQQSFLNSTSKLVYNMARRLEIQDRENRFLEFGLGGYELTGEVVGACKDRVVIRFNPGGRLASKGFSLLGKVTKLAATPNDQDKLMNWKNCFEGSKVGVRIRQIKTTQLYKIADNTLNVSPAPLLLASAVDFRKPTDYLDPDKVFEVVSSSSEESTSEVENEVKPEESEVTEKHEDSDT